MLRENHHGTEARGDLPHEARVGSEPLDVAFIPAVQEDGSEPIGPDPVLRADEVPLPERRQLREAEVVELLLEVPRLVSVPKKLIRPPVAVMGFGGRESAEEPRGAAGGDGFEGRGR